MDGELVAGRTAGGDRLADQRDPPPWRVGLLTPEHVGWTRLQAEATADAVADVLLPGGQIHERAAHCASIAVR